MSRHLHLIFKSSSTLPPTSQQLSSDEHLQIKREDYHNCSVLFVTVMHNEQLLNLHVGLGVFLYVLYFYLGLAFYMYFRFVNIGHCSLVFPAFVVL